MWFADLGIRRNDSEDLLLDILRQRLFEQFAQARADEVEGDLEDEDRHDQGRNGVGDPPFRAEEIGTADSGQRPERRKGVAAVVPGIGHDTRALERTALPHRITVEDLLGQDRNNRGDERHGARPRKAAALDDDPNSLDAVEQDPGADDAERQADDDRGEGFVLPVSVVVAGIAGLGGDPRESDHHDIRGQVGERMHGIGNHGTASAQDTGRKFQQRQHEVDHEPDKGDVVDFPFPNFRFVRHKLNRLAVWAGVKSTKKFDS